MKLKKPIIINTIPYKINNIEIQQNYTILNELDVTYKVRPKAKTITATIQHIPKTIILALPSYYEAIENQISLSLLEQMLEHKLGDDPQKFIDSLVPYSSINKNKTLPGSVLLRLLSKCGININSTCRCLAYIDQMNKNGIEWCKSQRSELLNRLKSESIQQKITFDQTLAEKLLDKSINISSKLTNKKKGLK